MLYRKDLFAYADGDTVSPTGKSYIERKIEVPPLPCFLNLPDYT